MIRRILLKCWWITSSPRTDSKIWIEFEWMRGYRVWIIFDCLCSLDTLCVWWSHFWSWSCWLWICCHRYRMHSECRMHLQWELLIIYTLSPLYTFPLILISIEYMYLEWKTNTISISEWNTLAKFERIMEWFSWCIHSSTHSLLHSPSPFSLSLSLSVIHCAYDFFVYIVGVTTSNDLVFVFVARLVIDESDLNQCEGDSKVYQIMLCFHVALNVAADDQPPYCTSIWMILYREQC